LAPLDKSNKLKDKTLLSLSHGLKNAIKVPLGKPSSYIGKVK